MYGLSTVIHATTNRTTVPNAGDHPSGSGSASDQGNDDGNGDTQANASTGDPDFYQGDDPNWGSRGD